MDLLLTGIVSLSALTAALSLTGETKEAKGIHLLWRHFKSFHPLSSPTAPVSEGVRLSSASSQLRPLN